MIVNACVACSLTHIAAALLILAKKPYPSMNNISEQVMGSITASVVLLERHSFSSHALLLSSNIIFTTVAVLELGLTLTKNSPGLPFEGDPIILTHPSGNDCTRIERLATTKIVRNTADMLSIFPHKLHESAWISTSVQLIYRNWPSLSGAEATMWSHSSPRKLITRADIENARSFT